MRRRVLVENRWMHRTEKNLRFHLSGAVVRPFTGKVIRYRSYKGLCFVTIDMQFSTKLIRPYSRPRCHRTHAGSKNRPLGSVYYRDASISGRRPQHPLEAQPQDPRAQRTEHPVRAGDFRQWPTPCQDHASLSCHSSGLLVDFRSNMQVVV